MKINIKAMPYEKVMALPRPSHKHPLRPNFLLHTVIRIASIFDTFPVKFTYTKHRMDIPDAKKPCLILMNHSSFIDLKIASHIFYPRRYGIVCTTDALVGFGMPLLMRLIGCIPTQKFVSDVTLIRDMEYLLKKKKASVLMYPEAGYSFDGRATTLPRKMGILLKKLGVPVITVITKGAFARDPLYNGLQKRKVTVSADVTCLLTEEEIRSKSVAELDAMVEAAFGFDQFAWQQEQDIAVSEPFRADGLHRVLYQCPHCGAEGKTEGKGIYLTCHNCGKIYELTEKGYLQALDCNTKFSHIPDWYDWQRQQVRTSLENSTYRLETAVDIGMLVDHKELYMVGSGTLIHDDQGFRLTGCDGKLMYTQGPVASHTLNADYYWYEIGDVICIGNKDALYYCFPKGGDPVAKTRLAVEELYKLKKRRTPLSSAET